jgi:dTDP-4-dehydrorhamnose reductase
MKLWGGIECSLNRVQSRRCDQLALNGHYARGDDLEQIAALGIRTLRYPLLWERAATASPEEYDWRFADDRLSQMRALGIEPIAGLVHHGCGPDHTDLLAENFSTGLAHYAGKLAERFPWVEWYTPVNEPLTTARFSGLYGLWHPHAADPRSFTRILLNECRAVVLAMEAVRRVNPAARLMQTDDLGTIYSTPALAYQADFENERRWLAWDLLCGKVDVGHPMYRYLRGTGISARELGWFQDHACPPAIIGIDHYVTSDRFLDEDIERYPRCHHGGNGRQRYADVTAVRVRETPGTSLRQIVEAAARRYGLPVVLAEVHIGCTPDEQLRWLHDAWTTCCELEARGVDIRAVTAWAMFGSYDWDSLLTVNAESYEAGVFAVVDGALRRTPLAAMVESLAREGAWPHEPPGKGWWLRDERLIYRHRSPRHGNVHRPLELPIEA